MSIPGFAQAAGSALIVGACLGCASITPGHAAPPPVPGQAITVWITELEARAGHEFYARNDSDRIQRITGIALRDCSNVRQECGTHRLDVVLCPGDVRRIFAVRFRNSEDRVFFNWDYEARGYEPGEPVVGADCEPRGG